MNRATWRALSVTARGNERITLFRDEADWYHFLELLSQLGECFGLRVHAYVLLDNHYHLLLETPEVNLSRAKHWLNAGYCVWFNRRHRRCGHLMQGRFGAFAGEDDAGWQEVASWGEIVSAVERVKGEPWEAFAQPPGDSGRDAPLWLGGRLGRLGRLRLAPLGELAVGLDYAVVGKAVTRFGERLAKDEALRSGKAHSDTIV